MMKAVAQKPRTVQTYVASAAQRRRGSREHPLDEVGRTGGHDRGPRGADLPRARRPLEADLAHQAVDLVAPGLDAQPVQGASDLAHPVHPEVRPVDELDDQLD